MAVYDRQTQTALRLIAAKGQAVTWRSLTNTVADANKPWLVTNAIAVDHSVSIAFFNVDLRTKKFIQFMKGLEVSEGSLIGYMPRVDFTPAKKDVVVRNGVQYVVETIDVIAPNGEGVILYILEFKT